MSIDHHVSAHNERPREIGRFCHGGNVTHLHPNRGPAQTEVTNQTGMKGAFLGPGSLTEGWRTPSPASIQDQREGSVYKYSEKMLQPPKEEPDRNLTNLCQAVIRMLHAVNYFRFFRMQV